MALPDNPKNTLTLALSRQETFAQLSVLRIGCLWRRGQQSAGLRWEFSASNHPL
jgi:hypothetical protein